MVLSNDLSTRIVNKQPLPILHNFGSSFSLVWENLDLFGGILSFDVGLVSLFGANIVIELPCFMIEPLERPCMMLGTLALLYLLDLSLNKKHICVHSGCMLGGKLWFCFAQQFRKDFFVRMVYLVAVFVSVC